MKRRRIFVEMPNNLVPSPRPLLILLDEAFDYVTECVLRAANALPLLRRRVAAQADPGMQLAGNLSCPCRLHRRGVAQDEPPSPSTNLVPKNPRTGSAGASFSAPREAAVSRILFLRRGTYWEAREAVSLAMPRRACTGRFERKSTNHGNFTGA